MGNLGELEQIVLMAVLRLGADAYGVPVHADIERRTGRELSIAAIYKTLERLREKGFLTARVGDPTPVRGGRAKRQYTITSTGRQALKASIRTIRRMAHGLDVGLEPS
ncbi:MAG TPA: helix-turn-helix transcriptional regulator [Gemmatimonadaceae bacterium]|nr:helix-turn-helix transcriptional regulator [Gemmatimonadaceae bacterium]